MKNTFLVLIARVFFFVLLLAEYSVAAECPPALRQPTREMVETAKRDARDHGFLWRISKEGRSSYLYGTIHVAKFGWTVPGPQVIRALRATDTIALEMDMLDGEVQAGLASGMAGLRSAALPAGVQQRIRQQATALCVPYASISPLTPELQVTALTMMVGRSAGLESAYAIDVVLAQLGHSANKNMVSLETPELQMRLLQMESEQETISFVEDSLDELEAGRSLRMLQRIADAWAGSDYAQMERFEEWCECLGTPTEREVMKRALDDRNPALAEKIDGLHRNGQQVFAAVGSLHMFGPLGLPLLMEKRGYRVERVSFAR